MTRSNFVVRKTVEPADPERKLWPITVILVLLASFVSGVIISISDFETPRLLANGYFRLSVVAFTVAVLIGAAFVLRGKVLARVQMAVLLSLLLHLFLLFAMREIYMARLLLADETMQDQLPLEELITIPETGVPLETEPQPEQPFEKLVETPVPDKPEEIEPERETPVDPTTKPVVKPQEVPKTSESTQPRKVDLQRTEVSTSRQSEQISGKTISRQEMQLPDTTAQTIPQPKMQKTETKPRTEVAEAQPTVVQKQATESKVAERPTTATAPSSTEIAPKVEVQRQPSREVAESPTRPAPALSKQTAQLPSPAAAASAAKAAPAAKPAAAAPAAPSEAATQVAKAAPSSAAPSGKASPTPAPAAPSSTATAAATEVARAQRSSTPDARSQSNTPTTIARTQGATQPANTPETAESVAVAPSTSQKSFQAEAAPTAVSRAAPGTAGSATERNFTSEMPTAPSVATSASAAAQRSESSRTDAPDSAAAPSQTAAVPKSVAGSQTTAAALPAEAVEFADTTGSRTPQELESTSSAATRTASSSAAPSTVQAAAGSSSVDLGATQTVAPSPGLSRGSASTGGGTPSLSSSTQPPQIGRSSRAGEPTAAVAAAEAAPAVTAPGKDPSRIAGPSVESSEAVATRQSSTAPTGGSTPGATAAVPLGTAQSTGAASIAKAEPSTATGSGSETGSSTQVALARSSTGSGDQPSEAEMATQATTGNSGTGSSGTGRSTEAALDASGVATTERSTGDGSATSVTRDSGGSPQGTPGGTTGTAIEATDTAATRSDVQGDSPATPSPGGDKRTTLPERSVAQLGTPGSTATTDDPSMVVLEAGPQAASDGLDLQPGTEQQQRKAAGVQVQVASAPGTGGLTIDKPLDIGLPERRAQRDSDVVNLEIARFILEKSMGRPDRDTRSKDDVVPTYVLRKPENREKVAQQFGGSRESEQAVELGLDFLARQQEADGRWVLHGFRDEPATDKAFTNGKRKETDTAGTGLALLAFLGAGYHHLDNKYEAVVRRGLDWLKRNQKPDGDLYIGGNDSTNRLYSHGIAAIALCEAYAMTRDPELREPAQKALRFILRAQDLRWGGWRYRPSYEAPFQTDTSVTGWQMMALKSGELSGFDIPKDSYAAVGRWLDYAGQQSGSMARYSYLPAPEVRASQPTWHAATPVMTAEALLMRMYLGWDRENANLLDGADFLRQNLPPSSMNEQGKRDCYYWYYATQVMFQLQGDHWNAWNDRLRTLLIKSQQTSGALAGSWDPRGDKWGDCGGRIYVTTMHLLMLEVYYRHLPLYRIAEEPGK